MSTERPLIGCDWHDGADIDACGCPALDSPGAIAYRGLLVKARAEIARLTDELAAARAEVDCGQDGPCAQAPGCARHWQERNRELADELAAARAVPADVEAAIGELEHRAFETGHGYGVADMAKMSRHADLRVTARDLLRTAIARAISDATAARGTVGGLLATAPVGAIVEFFDGQISCWYQVRISETGFVDSRAYRRRAWVPWRPGCNISGDIRAEARLVPVDQADADPAMRGEGWLP